MSRFDGMYQIVYGGIEPIAYASQAEIELGEIGALEQPRRDDLRRVVDRFVVFRRATVHHIVITDRQMQLAVVLAGYISVQDSIISVERGQFPVEVISVIDGRFIVAGVYLHNTGEGMHAEMFGHAYADIGSN